METVRQALTHTPPEHRWYPNRLSRLGGLLQYLFATRGDLSDLDEAVTYTRAAVSAVTPEHEDWAMFQSNLGRTLQMRLAMTGRDEDLDAAHEAMSAAIDSDDLTPMLASRMGILQQLTLARFLIRGDEADLQQAMTLAEQAWELTQAGDMNLWDRALDLARTHAAFWAHTGAAEHARAGAELARQVLAATIPQQAEHQEAQRLLENLRGPV